MLTSVVHVLLRIVAWPVELGFRSWLWFCMSKYYQTEDQKQLHPQHDILCKVLVTLTSSKIDSHESKGSCQKHSEQFFSSVHEPFLIALHWPSLKVSNCQTPELGFDFTFAQGNLKKPRKYIGLLPILGGTPKPIYFCFFPE